MTKDNLKIYILRIGMMLPFKNPSMGKFVQNKHFVMNTIKSCTLPI